LLEFFIFLKDQAIEHDLMFIPTETLLWICTKCGGVVYIIYFRKIFFTDQQ